MPATGRAPPTGRRAPPEAPGEVPRCRVRRRPARVRRWWQVARLPAPGPPDVTCAFTAKAGPVLLAAGQRGGRPPGRRTEAASRPVAPVARPTVRTDWSRNRSEQARQYAAQCHRPPRPRGKHGHLARAEGTNGPCRLGLPRPDCWHAMPCHPAAGRGGAGKHCAEATVRMAGRMSSRGTGRRDPARVPSAVLRNRILARSRLPVLIVMLAIGYGTAGYWLVEGKNLLDALLRDHAHAEHTRSRARVRRRVPAGRSSPSR